MSLRPCVFAHSDRCTKQKAKAMHPVNFHLPGVRASYQDALLNCLKLAAKPLLATEIRSAVGGTGHQARTGLHVLIEQGKVREAGNTRNTRYSICEQITPAVTSAPLPIAEILAKKSPEKVIADAVSFITRLPKIRAHNGRRWVSDPIGCAHMIAHVLSTPEPQRTLKTIAERTGCRHQTLVCLLDGRTTSGSEWPAFKNELDRLLAIVPTPATPAAAAASAPAPAPTSAISDVTYEIDQSTGDIYMITKTRIRYGTPEHQTCLVRLHSR